MKKILIFLILIINSLWAIQISSTKVKNANTLLLELTQKDISDVKLSFEKLNINFMAHPFKANSFYALLPIDYYTNSGKYKIIVSYLKNNKREFIGQEIFVEDGNYKSEIIKVQKSKVTLNEKDKIRTQYEYKEAMDIYNTSTSKIFWTKEFIYPMNSKITSDFGNKRVYNNTIKSFHSGTDFKAAIGTKIKAINDGVVVLAKDRFYAGNSIIIDHGQGVYSCYFHLSKMNYKEGDFVKRGEVIALSGDTGRVTGPHLHFSIRINSKLIDPLQAIWILNQLNN